MQRRKQGFDSVWAAESPPPRWLVADTALGWLAVAWAGPQVAALSFGHSAAAAAAGTLGMPGSPADDPHRHELQLLRRLQAFARGTPDDFRDVPVRLDDLTEFQRRVLEACRQIAYGSTRTYTQLAAAAGRPRAARALARSWPTTAFR